ncbi:hypothetical protein [Streptomyces sp. Wb2n-11]|uniref:hypothetical protein n=1 Tax=Streptomyces sp. Wb2n-11 TaxID=1030533 RepID=UPI000A856374|nr:hypothetical protein [Streptomyces sp. Wb2n-11]
MPADRISRRIGRRPLMAATAALGAAVLALTLTAASEARPAAPASARPGFLAARDLPQAEGISWSAGRMTGGAPDPRRFCLERVVPVGDSTRHRGFSTELDTWAVQVTVRAKDAADCAADWPRATPGGTASWEDYGPVPGEEGVHVYGVHTSVPDSEPGVHPIGVGRDGRTVTLVQWARTGGLSDAPVPAFKRTARTAVAKLH